jgi:uncharacterized lipoprotein
MKNNIFKLIMVLVVFVLLLSGCNGSRYAQGDRGDRRSSHHQGVNTRNYRGY